MSIAIAAPCAAQLLPAGFVYEAVATPPFSGSPIGFAFLPDGRIILIEKQGRVRVVPVGSLITTGILLVPNVDSVGGEEGLLGVAVDPDWPTRPYLYFCYTRTDSVTCVTMYTASGQLTNPTSTNLVLSSPFHLLTDIPNIDDEHNAGTVRFGPDGMLSRARCCVSTSR
ncbi:MAG: PQQ-dependent sugar dehydrogenase [bacterium]